MAKLVRRDLAEACAEVGIAPVTPNDLRRTFATWLRQGGAEPALNGQAMGHADSRMVERVYGRLEPSELGAVLATRLLAGARRWVFPSPELGSATKSQRCGTTALLR